MWIIISFFLAVNSSRSLTQGHRGSQWIYGAFLLRRSVHRYICFVQNLLFWVRQLCCSITLVGKNCYTICTFPYKNKSSLPISHVKGVRMVAGQEISWLDMLWLWVHMSGDRSKFLSQVQCHMDVICHMQVYPDHFQITCCLFWSFIWNVINCINLILNPGSLSFWGFPYMGMFDWGGGPDSCSLVDQNITVQ